MLVTSPPAAGVERVLLPGELEQRAEARHRETGVPLSREVCNDLLAIGDECGVRFPQPLRNASHEGIK